MFAFPLDPLPTGLFQFFRYLGVGAAVTLADLLIYNFLSGPVVHMPRIPANIISVTLGMILGFTLHFALVFRPSEARIINRLIGYAITVGISVYGVQNLVIYALAEVWRCPARMAQNVARMFELSDRCSDDFIDRMSGKTAAVLVGMSWNYLFFKFLVYA